MSVLPYHYECPIDWAIIKLCSAVAPFFRATGHTPNMITFEGAIASVVSLYMLKNNRLKEFAVLHFVAYALDCLDGHFARRYKMVSKFGEYFEHIKDILATMGYFYVLVKNYEISLPIVAIFAIAGGGLLSHMGHQQKYLGSSGGFLDPLQHLAKDVKSMKHTRWFGCGTFMLISIVVPFIARRLML